MSVQFLQTPIGILTLQENDNKLTRVDFLFGRCFVPSENFPEAVRAREKDKLYSFTNKELDSLATIYYHDEFRNTTLLNQTQLELLEYFEGTRRRFDLPLNPKGTKFRQKVWQELSKIPYGTVETYGTLARRVGQPKAARAVGAAMRDNQIVIILPCHRVVGSQGKLTGYNGGLDRKTFLLELESPHN